MAKISFRPERLMRVRVGEGLHDPVSDDLVRLGGMVSAQPDDGASEVLKPKTIALLDAMSRVNAACWEARDDWQSRYSTFGEMLKRSLQSAVANVSPSGWGDGASYQAALAGARTRATAEFVDSLTGVVLDGFAERAGKLAQQFSDAGTALELAIRDQRNEHDSPGDVELSALAQRADWESRIKAKPHPCAYALQKLTDYIAAGRTDRLDVLIPVCERIAIDTLETPPPKQGVKRRATFYRDYLTIDGDPDNAQAAKLLRAIQDYRRDTEPKWITTADSILGQVRPWFVTLVGTDARFLTYADRQRMYYSVDARQEKPQPWETVPPKTWLARMLPAGSGFSLPGHGPQGWSPIASRLSSGGIVRVGDGQSVMQALGAR
jgi:hypothetical protein